MKKTMIFVRQSKTTRAYKRVRAAKIHAFMSVAPGNCP